MADENRNIPVDFDDENDRNPAQSNDTSSRLAGTRSTTPPTQDDVMDDDDLGDRLERLGGEPAPVITPEEFARLQKAGQVHIDSRGRVRTARRSGSEAGVSLRKRRAWYGA